MACRVIPFARLPWAPIGEDGFWIRVDTIDKKEIPALASVPGACEKLSLFLIANRRTVQFSSCKVLCHHFRIAKATSLRMLHNSLEFVKI
jgi:hypothetical protein